MHTFTELFDLVGGRRLQQEDDGSARRLQIGIRATLASVLFAGIWGLAAGSTDLVLALTNLYKLPMVILLSTACALPAGLLAWKLTESRIRASDLLIGVASGNLTATLVLAALAPLVALYYLTSGFVGGNLAMVTCFLAVGVGLFTIVRAVMNRAPAGWGRSAALPLLVLVAVQLASLVQFIHVASPILPETTVFDGGVDQMLEG